MFGCPWDNPSPRTIYGRNNVRIPRHRRIDEDPSRAMSQLWDTDVPLCERGRGRVPPGDPDSVAYVPRLCGSLEKGARCPDRIKQFSRVYRKDLRRPLRTKLYSQVKGELRRDSVNRARDYREGVSARMDPPQAAQSSDRMYGRGDWVWSCRSCCGGATEQGRTLCHCFRKGGIRWRLVDARNSQYET